MDKKQKQMQQHTKETGERLTTNNGTKIENNQDQLKAGVRGPVLMEDFVYRDKMTHFDHERIPERVVHARGSGAYGYFESYEPLTDLTKAKFLNETDRKTPVFVRFSTVAGFRGSADTVRDVRGFAVRFYTDEGNYDLVGNNMAPFFIQDAIKFPDVIHSVKPEPHNEMPQAASAHDTFWDFISLSPESMHMIMWAMSDRALPRSYATMEGFGVHTFRLVNEEGKSRFVKFHWKPTAGTHSMVWDEMQKMAGKDPDFNRGDLWERIEDGNFPEWELGIQVMEEEDEHNHDFDILDPTKLWPEEDIPVKLIGKMVLNRNPDNFFAETEQVAFHPGHVVPGIDFTNDPLLQGRLFSYIDTQLTRLGGPNFNEIPINRPVCPVNNNQRDGFMRQTVNKGQVNYEPNSLAKGCPMSSSADMGGFKSYMEKMQGTKVRAKSEKFDDHYSQAVLFYNSMTEVEQQHIIDALRFELGKLEHVHIQEKMVEHLNRINHDMAKKVANAIGVDAPSESKVEDKGKKSPALSLTHRMPDHIKARKVAILLEAGYDHGQLTVLQDFLKKEGAKSEVISEFLGKVKSSGNESTKPDGMHASSDSLMYDAVYVPGGKKSVDKMKDMDDAINFVKEAYKHGKPIAATAEGGELLKAAQLKGLNIQGDANSFKEKGVIISKGGDGSFHGDFKKAIAKHRHWDRKM